MAIPIIVDPKLKPWLIFKPYPYDVTMKDKGGLFFMVLIDMVTHVRECIHFLIVEISRVKFHDTYGRNLPNLT